MKLTKMVWIITLLLVSLVINGVSAQDDPSEAPSISASLSPTGGPNECNDFEAGDFAFIYVNSVDPGDEVSIFLFNDVPGGMKLYLTDNAWTGSTFLSNEGTLEYTVPSAGLSQGETFGSGPNFPDFTWTSVQGTFSLDTEGEQVFLYCFGGNGNPVPLAGISYNGDFKDAGLASYGFGESALPEEIASAGSIALAHCDEWRYAGQLSGTVEELQALMGDTSQWQGKDCESSGANSVFSPIGQSIVLGILPLVLL